VSDANTESRPKPTPADTPSAGTTADLVELLCRDMLERRRQGQRVSAETYLRLHPQLLDDAEAAFELIYAEFALREQCGEAPPVEEFQWRFPAFADRLRRQLELRRTLLPEDAEAENADGVSTGPLPQRAAPSDGSVPVLSDYEILDELGRGGTGVVYRARQRSLNRIVALKVFRDSVLADPEERRRFQREAEVVAALRHPHIVQIHEVGQAEGHAYLCLEHVAGGSLDRQLAGNPQEPLLAARLTRLLAEAMHHAHGHGVIHRDLKPGNVLLASGGREPPVAAEETRGIRPPLANLVPRIADFGLARRLDTNTGDTRSGDILGTPSYMAPEQAFGRNAAVDARTDVYALGAILYEMLTGHPPFKGATVLDTLVLVTDSDPVPPCRLLPSGVPRDLETICLKCLSKEPTKRYASAAELADDLGRFERGEPIRARPIGVLERAVKWVRRRPTTAALLAAVVALLIAGTVVSTTFGVLALRKAKEAELNADTAGRREREAAENAQLARKNAQQANEALFKGRTTLARGLGRPLGFETFLRPSEAQVLWELSDTDDEVRDLFFTEALSQSDTAARLARRADVAVHAAVGLSGARRLRLRGLLLERLREGQADLEVREACLALGDALEVQDEAWCQAMGDVVVARLERTSEPHVLLNRIQAVAVRTGRLDERQAGDLSARVMRLLLGRLRGEPSPMGRTYLAQGVSRLAPHLPAAEAASALSAVLEVLAAAGEAGSLGELATAFAALVVRLDTAQADFLSEPAVPVLLDRLRQPRFYSCRSKIGQALTILAARLSLRQATATYRRLRESLAQESNSIVLLERLRITAALADRLDRRDAAEAAEHLLAVVLGRLRLPAEDGPQAATLAALVSQLVPLLARTEPTEASGQTTLQALADAADTETVWGCGLLLAALADRLPPGQGARLALEALEVLLVRIERQPAQALLPGRVIDLLAPRVGPKEAAGLMDRLRKTMAAAPAVEASLPAFKALAARLPPADAERHTAEVAHLVADRIQAAPNSAAAERWSVLVADLAGRLPRQQAEEIVRRAASALLARLPVVTQEAGEVRGLTALAGLLPAATAAVATSEIIDQIGQPSTPHADMATALVALAPRLDAAQARPLARKFVGHLSPLALDRLPKTQRVAPLARAASALTVRLPSEEASTLGLPVIRELLARLRRSSDPIVLSDLAEAVAALVSARNAPDAEDLAFEAAHRILDGPAVNAEGPTAAALANALRGLAERTRSQQVIDLLKHPLCVGPYAAVLLSELSRREQRPFADVWQVADWAEGHEPPLDWASAPRRFAH
jgi:hypothetical protein